MLRIAVLAGLLTAGPAAAADDAERRAKAAFALCPPRGAAATAACECPPGTRGDAQTQFARALKEQRPVILFAFGAEPRCCQGQLVAVTDRPLAGVSKARPIVVYAPVSGAALRVVAELPANCPLDQLKAAVKRAQDALIQPPK